MKKSLKLCLTLLVTVTLFNCGGSQPPPSSAPTVVTSAVTDITFTTAISGGEIMDTGGELITDRGLCWSTNPNPTISDNVISATTNTFISDISGLSQHGGTYFVRAYATNLVGTSYGNQVTFDSWNLDDTKWAFLLDYDANNLDYPGDVDFFADGTTKWDEPSYPGQYTTFGTWKVEGNVVTYNMMGDPAATSYIYTGIVVDNLSMSGTFTWGANPAKDFTATRYP